MRFYVAVLLLLIMSNISFVQAKKDGFERRENTKNYHRYIPGEEDHEFEFIDGSIQR